MDIGESGCGHNPFSANSACNLLAMFRKRSSDVFLLNRLRSKLNNKYVIIYWFIGRVELRRF
jgi:hypothetical protein